MTRILKMKATTWALLSVFVLTASVSVISCNGSPDDVVCIPVSEDSSALGNKEHFIPVDSVNDLRKNFAEYRDTLSKRVPDLYFALSEAFNKDYILRILKDPRNVGIRIYYGVLKDTTGKQQNEFRLVLVGVDEKGNDLFITRPKGPRSAAKSEDAGDGKQGGLEYGQCNPPCNNIPE